MAPSRPTTPNGWIRYYVATDTTTATPQALDSATIYGMPDTFAILALRRKRARIAGEIEHAERRIDPLRAALAHLDAVLRLFDDVRDPEPIPAIRPTTRGTFFRHSEHMRLCLDALREAEGPMRVREGVVDQVRVALTRLERRGWCGRSWLARECGGSWWGRPRAHFPTSQRRRSKVLCRQRSKFRILCLNRSRCGPHPRYLTAAP